MTKITPLLVIPLPPLVGYRAAGRNTAVNAVGATYQNVCMVVEHHKKWLANFGRKKRPKGFGDMFGN